MPINGNAAADPPPTKLTIFYIRKCTTDAIFRNNTQYPSPTISTQVNCDSVQAHISQTYSQPTGNNTVIFLDTHLDSEPVKEILDVTVGTATKVFNPICTLTISQKMIKDNEAEGTIEVDMCVNGFDVSRISTPPSRGNHGGGINRGVHHQGGPLNFSGNSSAEESDPTFTRWLPLSFSPLVQSQQFRFQAGTLPAPWGNLQSTYAINLKQEPTPPNYDLPGNAQLFAPTLGNPPGPPYRSVAGSFVPKYTITDSTGERLHFDPSLVRYSNVFSSLTYDIENAVYTLSNAGPPGAIRQNGNYTYKFAVTSAGSAQVATRLTSITDDLGNQQVLAWGLNSSLVTVMDNSSLLFAV